MLRKEVRHFKEITNLRKSDQCTQTVEEQSVVSSAMVSLKYVHVFTIK